MLHVFYRDPNRGDIEAGTGFIRVSLNRGSPLSITMSESGVTMVTDNRTRELSWDDLRRLHANGMPEACRWGVVLGDRLHMVYDGQLDAAEKAAQLRADGNDCHVIRLPIDLV
jgi:hypothetical protein